MHNTKINYVNITLAALALLNILLHLYASYNLEYHRDELLYFSLGQHPAFGYATVPPLTGWLAWIMHNLFGYSIFAVRILPALMSGVMIFLVAAIAGELGGSGFSRILAAVGIFVSITGLRTFLMFQPVFLDLFFWTLIFYLVVKYINTLSGKYLVFLGIAAGFAFLNKYLIGLLILLLILILPFTRYRNVFRNRSFWYGIIACLLIFLPNIIWQISKDLPVISHFGELKRTQLVNVDPRAFLTEQLLMPGMASILTIAGILSLFISRKLRKYSILGLTALAVVFTLMLLHGKSYYTQGIFPFFIAAGAVSWDQLLKKTWSRVLIIIVIIGLTLPVLPIGIPIYKPAGLITYFNKIRGYGNDFVTRFEDNSIHSLPQDYADMLGWEELTSVVNKAWQQIPDKSSGFIYCENYGQAGAVTVIGKKYGLPEAISFNESFQYWIPRKFDREISSVVYVNDEMGDDVKSLFGNISRIGSITNPDAREYGTTVWLCREPASSFNKFWEERIKHID